jgi:integrase
VGDSLCVPSFGKHSHRNDCSLMSSIGVRPEVTRDNMGHANVDVTQNVYNRTWWEERVEAVSMAAATCGVNF